MRKFVPIFVLFFNGCRFENEPLTTVVSGEIIHPIGSIITFRVDGENVVDTLDEKNHFRVVLDIGKPTQVRFRHGNEITFLYVSPGDDLTMSIDTDAFDESLTFEGRGAESNRYNAAMVLLGDSVGIADELFILSEDSFLLALRDIERLKLAYLDSFEIGNPAFIEFVKGTAKWEKISFKLNYEDRHKDMLMLDTFFVSDKYYGFLKDLDINDSTQLKYPNFDRYVDYVITEAIGSSSDKADEQDEIGRYYETVKELITYDGLKEDMLYKLLRMQFAYIQNDLRNIIIADWMSTNPSAKRIKEIDEMIGEWQKIAPGQPAPNFKFVSINGDSLTMEDFRGRLVYIDVWATWCGPCIAEHPDMAILQERFKNDEVVFVSVSIDPEPAQWKAMVAKKQLGGVHLYAPGQYQSKINLDYMINGIPRFILIDKEGKIIDADAERPSGNIGERIQEVLNVARSV